MYNVSKILRKNICEQFRYNILRKRKRQDQKKKNNNQLKIGTKKNPV